MFSWDLLFFYSIEFLFYTVTKKITASQVLIVTGLYMFFKVIGQIPAVTITDYLGKRKSIILGNIILISYVLILIFLPGMISIIIANLLFAIGATIKDIAGPNLLYDSVATKGGDGLYSKIESKGASWYYLLDGIASLVAGYLFVINNYLPMYICLGFMIISTVLSFGFHDIYPVQKKQEERKHVLKEYGKDLKDSFRFILKSKRMKAYILFGAVFYGIIETVGTYQGDLLVDVGISPEYFSMIFAIFTFIRGIALTLQKPIEKIFKNRTLTFLSLTYIASMLIVGLVASFYTGSLVIAIILFMGALQKTISAIWYLLEAKYVKNFTTSEVRNRMNFTYEFIGGIGGCIITILGGFLLDHFSASNAFVVAGLVSLLMMTLTLDYMRPRFGLKPEQYKEDDIKFEAIKK